MSKQNWEENKVENVEHMSHIEKLERDLSLKQLQINRLLEITQAINNNLSAKDLFKIYRSILSWELEIEKMALFIKQEKAWVAVCSLGIEDESILTSSLGATLQHYTRISNLQDGEDTTLQNFDIIIPVQHKDEAIAFALIGGLDDSIDMYEKVKFIKTITNIISVAIENKRLFKQEIEQERFKKEIELGKDVQQMLIPESLPANNNYELDSIYKPHFGVGGDYFDFMEFNSNEFTFCIGDISGKGVGAAILMSNFQATLQILMRERRDATDFIQTLNEAVLRSTKSDRFITFFIAEYNIETKILTYVNAGHNPPFIKMNGTIQELDVGCTILGAFPEIPFIDVGQMKLEGEALILTYTDGLTDLINEKNEFFSTTLLENFLRQHDCSSAAKFNQDLIKHIDIFKGNNPYPDDISVLTCKIF